MGLENQAGVPNGLSPSSLSGNFPVAEHLPSRHVFLEKGAIQKIKSAS